MTGAVGGDETLCAAAGRMVGEDLSCLVALESGLPRGLLTERELVRGVLCERLARCERVDAVPWRPMVAAAEGAHASEAVWLMESHALRHVPVADDGGALVGMLGFEDALALVLEEITALAAREWQRAVASFGAERGRWRPALEAKDVQTSVSCLDAGASVRHTAERLDETAMEMLIVREGTRTIGVVSERDLLQGFVAGPTDPDATCARDIARPLVTVAPDEPLDRILARMADQEIRTVGVAGPDGCSYGIVSLANLLASLTVEIAARVEFESRAGSTG